MEKLLKTWAVASKQAFKRQGIFTKKAAFQGKLVGLWDSQRRETPDKAKSIRRLIWVDRQVSDSEEPCILYKGG